MLIGLKGLTKMTDIVERPGFIEKVGVGGTFDRLHRGHRRLLEAAFSAGKRVVIGLSTDSFVKKLHKPHKVDCYEARLGELIRFLNDEGCLNRAQVVPLNDRFGIAASDPELEALVVSEIKESVAFEINSLRVKAGLKPLKILTLNMVLASDRRPISTTRIRRGIIDKEGMVLKRLKDH